jgi:hypothetical protein
VKDDVFFSNEENLDLLDDQSESDFKLNIDNNSYEQESIKSGYNARESILIQALKSTEHIFEHANDPEESERLVERMLDVSFIKNYYYYFRLNFIDRC